jgi:hypothetical protein
VSAGYQKHTPSLQVSATLGPTFRLATTEEKVAKRKELLAPGGKVHTLLNLEDKLLGASQSKFFAGDSPGLVDVQVFCGASQLLSGCAFLLRDMHGSELGQRLCLVIRLR